MSYIFVVDEDKLAEESVSAFLSGEGSILFYKNRVREVRKMDLEEYCLDYADVLHNENIRRLNSLVQSEREEIFRDDPGIMYRSSPNILYIYKPSEVKKRLDDYEKGIKVGDVILYSYCGGIVRALVTKVGKGACCMSANVIQKDGTVDICSLDDCKKTEKHYDSIDEFMKEGM